MNGGPGMRNWLDRFMLGRNGVDFLNRKLLVLMLILWLLGIVLNSGFFSFLALAAAAYSLFRMFSRDLAARQQEDLAAREAYDRVKSELSGAWMRLRQSRDYKFFTCPGCGNRLRVPRGKGHIQITCPRCGQRFERKS